MLSAFPHPWKLFETGQGRWRSPPIYGITGKNGACPPLLFAPKLSNEALRADQARKQRTTQGEDHANEALKTIRHFLSLAILAILTLLPLSS